MLPVRVRTFRRYSDSGCAVPALDGKRTIEEGDAVALQYQPHGLVHVVEDEAGGQRRPQLGAHRVDRAKDAHARVPARLATAQPALVGPVHVDRGHGILGGRQIQPARRRTHARFQHAGHEPSDGIRREVLERITEDQHFPRRKACRSVEGGGLAARRIAPNYQDARAEIPELPRGRQVALRIDRHDDLEQFAWVRAGKRILDPCPNDLLRLPCRDDHADPGPGPRERRTDLLPGARQQANDGRVARSTRPPG